MGRTHLRGRLAPVVEAVDQAADAPQALPAWAGDTRGAASLSPVDRLLLLPWLAFSDHLVLRRRRWRLLCACPSVVVVVVVMWVAKRGVG